MYENDSLTRVQCSGNRYNYNFIYSGNVVYLQISQTLCIPTSDVTNVHIFIQLSRMRISHLFSLNFRECEYCIFKFRALSLRYIAHKRYFPRLLFQSYHSYVHRGRFAENLKYPSIQELRHKSRYCRYLMFLVSVVQAG